MPLEGTPYAGRIEGNPQGMRQVAAELEKPLDEIDALITRIKNVFPAAEWVSPNADKFREFWVTEFEGTMRTKLTEMFGEAATALRSNAEALDTAGGMQ